MSTPAMHLEAPGKQPIACDTCATPFTPRKRWARFCTPRCRNAFHAAEARLEKVRLAGPQMYEVLRAVRDIIRGQQVEHVWVNFPTEPAETLAQRIDKVLGPLKPPESPKALLEKTKA